MHTTNTNTNTVPSNDDYQQIQEELPEINQKSSKRVKSSQYSSISKAKSVSHYSTGNQIQKTKSTTYLINKARQLSYWRLGTFILIMVIVALVGFTLSMSKQSDENPINLSFLFDILDKSAIIKDTAEAKALIRAARLSKRIQGTQAALISQGENQGVNTTELREALTGKKDTILFFQTLPIKTNKSRAVEAAEFKFGMIIRSEVVSFPESTYEPAGYRYSSLLSLSQSSQPFFFPSIGPNFCRISRYYQLPEGQVFVLFESLGFLPDGRVLVLSTEQTQNCIGNQEQIKQLYGVGYWEELTISRYELYAYQ